VHRPDFERLIEAIETREVDLVVAVDLDRLMRGWKPYSGFYVACMRLRSLGGDATLKRRHAAGDPGKLCPGGATQGPRLYPRQAQSARLRGSRDAGGGRPFVGTSATATPVGVSAHGIDHGLIHGIDPPLHESGAGAVAAVLFPT